MSCRNCNDGKHVVECANCGDPVGPNKVLSVTRADLRHLGYARAGEILRAQAHSTEVYGHVSMVTGKSMLLAGWLAVPGGVL